MQKILIVDDEQSFSYLLEVILQRAGYETLVAENGQEGLEMVRRCQPNLVILDENMPLMRGSEVYRRMKAEPTLQNIPVIMHSSAVNLNRFDLKEYLSADAFLPKPSLPREVLKKVRRLIHTNHSVSSAAETAAV